MSVWQNPLHRYIHVCDRPVDKNGPMSKSPKTVYCRSTVRKKINAAVKLARASLLRSVLRHLRPDGFFETVFQSGAGRNTAWVRRFSGGFVIDPKTALLFRGRRLVMESTDNYRLRQSPDYFSVWAGARRHLPSVVSYRNGYEDNYYHLFQHVTTKSVLAEMAGIPPSVPALISERFARSHIGKQAIELGLLGDRTFVVQPDKEAISAEEIFVVRAPFDDMTLCGPVLDRLDARGNPDKARRLFLSRSRLSKNTRLIRNEKEVLAAIQRFGFSVVDPQDMSIADQMGLFSEAECIVSPHGAALTNMIFRRGAPLTVIEIVSPDLRRNTYEQIGCQFGFRYYSLLSENLRIEKRVSSSEIPVPQLLQLLHQLFPD